MTDAALLVTEVETLFTLDAAGLLLRVNEPGGGPAPRFLWGVTGEGSRWWRRDDFPVELAEAAGQVLGAAVPEPLAPVPDDVMQAVRAITARHAPVATVWHGPSFVFPDALPEGQPAVLLCPEDAALLARFLPDWVEDVAWRRPCAAVLVDGAAVAICAVARRGARALEAGVQTHPSWRQSGFAVAATARWAAAVRSEGRIPLYSTSWENIASQRVAARLGLRLLANLLHVS